MPTYCYCCEQCGEVSAEFRPISRRSDAGVCSKCGAVTFRHRGAEFTEYQRHNPNFSKPIEMYSIAPENPRQLQELRQKCPDVKFNDLLVPIARNRQEKLKLLKAVGYVENN